MDKGFTYQHAKDVGEGDRLAGALLIPQCFNVAFDFLRSEQQKWVVTHRVHQLLINLLWSFFWKIQV